MDQWPDFQHARKGKPSRESESQMNRGHGFGHLEGPTKKIKKWGKGRFFRWFFGGFLYWLLFRFVEDWVKMVKSLGVNSVAKKITFCPLDMETKMKENMDFLVISAPCHKLMRIPFRGCFFLDIFFPFPSLCPPESSAPRWFVAFGTDESEKCGSPNYSHLIWNMKMN